MTEWNGHAQENGRCAAGGGPAPSGSGAGPALATVSAGAAGAAGAGELQSQPGPDAGLPAPAPQPALTVVIQSGADDLLCCVVLRCGGRWYKHKIACLWVSCGSDPVLPIVGGD